MSVSDDDMIEQFTSKLQSVGPSRADVLGMAGFESIQDVANAKVYEVKELPCFGEQTASDAVLSAREAMQENDADDDEAVTADDEESGDSETQTVSHSGNPTGDRDDVIAVVAPDGRFDGMDNKEIRLELVRAFDRSPFDVSSVRTALDFEGEKINEVLRAHNELVSNGQMGKLNVLQSVETPWGWTNGKPDAELETTQSKYGSEHTYWTGAPGERNRKLASGVDGIIVLSDGGYVESAIYDWRDSGHVIYNAGLGETIGMGEQASIQEFDDEQLELGHQGRLDTDEGRDNPRSDVEASWNS